MSSKGKACRGCGEVKPLDNFTRRSSTKDGRAAKCRSCTAADSRKWRADHPERYREQQRRRKNLAEKRRAARRAYYARYPERKPVENRVRRAILAGKLVRPETCPECGRRGQILAHHEDYSRPLDVTWLCARCHQQLHNGLAVAQ